MGSASVAPIGAPSSTQWASNVKKRVVQAMQAVFWKWLQIVVGCGFCVILHTEWFIAAIMRVFYSPPALKKSRPTRDVHLLASASTVKVPAAASVEAKQSNGKPTDMPAIMIRAVAAAPDSVKPIMVYNDTVKGEPGMPPWEPHTAATACCPAPQAVAQQSSQSLIEHDFATWFVRFHFSGFTRKATEAILCCTRCT